MESCLGCGDLADEERIVGAGLHAAVQIQAMHGGAEAQTLALSNQ